MSEQKHDEIVCTICGNLHKIWETCPEDGKASEHYEWDASNAEPMRVVYGGAEMSGMDRLTDEVLEALEEALHWCEPAAGESFTVTMAQGHILHRVVCELLAHRRASHAQPTGTEPLPCPFCGGSPYVENEGAKDDESFVVCQGCGASSAPSVWNSRASQAAPAPSKPVGWVHYTGAHAAFTRFEAVANDWAKDGFKVHPVFLAQAPAPSDGLREALQALAWALPAEGDTIDRMRVMLWSSPEGRALNNRGDAKLYWLNEGDVSTAMLLYASPAQEVKP